MSSNKTYVLLFTWVIRFARIGKPEINHINIKDKKGETLKPLLFFFFILLLQRNRLSLHRKVGIPNLLEYPRMQFLERCQNLDHLLLDHKCIHKCCKRTFSYL